MSPNAQIWPRSLNTQIGGNAQSIYSIVSDLGNGTQPGMQFVLGMTCLYVFFPSAISVFDWTFANDSQRFYSVYDGDNKRVGFATTAVSF
jgi:hypothetical protein